jgi:hypothetical protein
VGTTKRRAAVMTERDGGRAGGGAGGGTGGGDVQGSRLGFRLLRGGAAMRELRL